MFFYYQTTLNSLIINPFAIETANESIDNPTAINIIETMSILFYTDTEQFCEKTALSLSSITETKQLLLRKIIKFHYIITLHILIPFLHNILHIFPIAVYLIYSIYISI